MSLVHVVLDRRSPGAEIANAQPHGVEALTSSNSGSVASTIAVPAGQDYRSWSWEVTALDTDAWVAFGAAPVAAAGSGHLVKSGETKRFLASAAGEKIAARDVA